MEVAVKLEQIRGTMETGFATINGRLDVTLTRTSQLEAELRDLRANELKDLRDDVESLKRNRWPLTALTALMAVAAVIVAALALTQQH